MAEKNIVAAIDFGKASKEVVAWAKLFKRFGFNIHFLNVIEKPIPPLFDGELLTEVIDALKKERLERLEEFADVDDEKKISEGVPVVEILQYAKEISAQIIIIGSKGEGKGNLTGTTALKVTRKSKIPVLVAKDGRKPSLKRILIYVDLSDSSKRAVELALKLRELAGSELNLLFVVKNPYEAFIRAVSSDEKAEKVIRDFENSSIEKLKLFLKETGVENSVDIQIERGNPPDVIRDVVKAKRIPLLLMGSEHMGGIQHFFLGSTAEKILRKLPTSLIITKPEEFDFSLP